MACYAERMPRLPLLPALALAAAGPLAFAACGGDAPGSAPNADGGVVVLADGAVVSPTATGPLPDGAPPPPPDAGPPPGPVAPLELRYVAARVTRAVDANTLAQRVVLAATYPGGLSRAVAGTAWDVRDPVTGRYYAQYTGGGKSGLYSVGTDGAAELVVFDGNTTSLFADALYWGTSDYAGDRLFLSGRGGAFVARRKGATLAFEAPVALGKSVEIVHDVSPNGALAIVSGVKPYKWGDAENVVAPRMYSIFKVNADGTLGADVSSQYAPFTSLYAQAPHFLQDGSGVVFEGDDDANTGDHLFIYAFGGAVKEFVPKAFTDMDFNTPCALADGRVAFWESVDSAYYLRLHDLAANTTKSAVTTSFPFSGYVRCR